jgi:hypothetical protein
MRVPAITVTRWSSSPSTALPDRRSAARCWLSTVGVLLAVLITSLPASATSEATANELQVVAVHTASAPRVSVVVEAPAGLRDQALTSDDVSVTVGGKPVAATVTPLASRGLSVALVIDTGSDVTAQELAAVQSGATELLLRLPPGAHTLVVDAGWEPEVVASLSPQPSAALSAVSAARTAGPSSAQAGVLLAAEALQAAPPGPRAIIVCTPGIDDHGVLAARLSQAVLQAEAVVHVILTGADPIWEWVVDRTGGTIVRTDASQVVQSYADLATALADQYLLAFTAPGELPTTAEVTVRSGEQEYRRAVTMPTASTTGDADGQSSERSPAVNKLVPIILILAGIAVTVLGVFVYRRHARHAAAAASTEPSGQVAGPTAGAPTSPAIPNATPAAPATTLRQRPSPRGSLSAAVQGRRLAQQTRATQGEPQSSAHPQREMHPEQATDDLQASSHGPNHLTKAATTPVEPPQVPPLRRSGLDDGARAANALERSAENGDNAINGADRKRRRADQNDDNRPGSSTGPDA